MGNAPPRRHRRATSPEAPPHQWRVKTPLAAYKGALHPSIPNLFHKVNTYTHNSPFVQMHILHMGALREVPATLTRRGQSTVVHNGSITASPAA